MASTNLIAYIHSAIVRMPASRRAHAVVRSGWQTLLGGRHKMLVLASVGEEYLDAGMSIANSLSMNQTSLQLVQVNTRENGTF